MERALQRRHQTTSFHLVGSVEAPELGDGGEDVDDADRGVDNGAAPGLCGRFFAGWVVGQPHDQRDPQRRLVKEEAVRRFAVLVKRLAVVRGEDDRGVGPHAEQLEPRADLRDE